MHFKNRIKKQEAAIRRTRCKEEKQEQWIKSRTTYLLLVQHKLNGGFSVSFTSVQILLLLYFVCRLVPGSPYKNLMIFLVSYFHHPLCTLFLLDSTFNTQAYLVIAISNNASSAISLFLLNNVLMQSLNSLGICMSLSCSFRFPPGAQFWRFLFRFNFHTTFSAHNEELFDVVNFLCMRKFFLVSFSMMSLGIEKLTAISKPSIQGELSTVKLSMWQKINSFCLDARKSRELEN